MKIGLITFDTGLQEWLEKEIRACGHEPVTAKTLSLLLNTNPGLVFAQWPMNSHLPEFLSSIRIGASQAEKTPIVVLVPQGAVALMMRARSEGAADVLFYPPDQDEIRAEIKDSLTKAEGIESGSQERFRELRRKTLLGESSVFRICLDDLKLAARCDANVLLVGETGTGKEMFTQAIHQLSRRAGNPLVAVNCASIPSTLLEAELFGHAKGAFTGADSIRHGRFEAVGAGTLLLDEIGDTEPGLQAKLLRVIEQRTFQRLGENKDIAFNARLVCATSVDLEKAVALGRFRTDLLGRVDQFRIMLPALRHRRTDIPLLARHFLKKHARGRLVDIGKTTMEILESYEFPMNVRQLENTVIAALARSDPDQLILPKHLPKDIIVSRMNTPKETEITIDLPSATPYKDARLLAVQAVDKLYLNKLLRKHNNNQTRAADEAGIDRKTFSERIGQPSSDEEIT
jgi:DNA-binding NtrC family response regulator